MTNPTEEEYEKDKAGELECMWQVVTRAIHRCGGDGDGAVVSPNYRLLADAFQKYELEHDNHFVSRTDYDGYIVFGSLVDQDGLMFADNRDKLGSWGISIIVEVQ
jgi:hypothetical protein